MKNGKRKVKQQQNRIIRDEVGYMNCLM